MGRTLNLLCLREMAACQIVATKAQTAVAKLPSAIRSMEEGLVVM
jgi:hypothetical protein